MSAAEGHSDGIEHLAEAAIALVGERRRAVLGIAGALGQASPRSPTTSLPGSPPQGADWVAHVPMDGFHLADVQLDRLGARDRKGAPDTFDADGYAHLLRRLLEQPDQPIYAPGFERTLEQPIAAAVIVPPSARLVVTEGNYLLLPEPRWEAARAHLTEVWHVTADDHTRQVVSSNATSPSARTRSPPPVGCARPTRPMRRSSRPPHTAPIASSSTRPTAGSPDKTRCRVPLTSPRAQAPSDGHRSVRDDGRTW